MRLKLFSKQNHCTQNTGQHNESNISIENATSKNEVDFTFTGVC